MRNIKTKDLIIEANYKRAHKYKGSLKIISKIKPDALVLDIGSGERRLKIKNFLSLDIYKNTYVDVLADAHNLPFRENIFDLIICEHLLEHVKKPWIVIEDIYRVIREKGIIYVEVPFMTPYHGKPNHYFNMSKSNLIV